MSFPDNAKGLPARGRSLLVPNLLVAVLWFLAWGVARILEYAPHASLWFPPAGLTFAAGLVLGWRGLPGILAASIAVTLTGLFRENPLPWHSLAGAGVAFGFSHALAYFAAARLQARLGETRPTARTVATFLVIAPVAALVATAGGIASLTIFGLIENPSAALRSALPWWIGDFVGLVALAPVFVVLLIRLADRFAFPVAGIDDAGRGLDSAVPSTGTFPMKLGVSLVPLAASALAVSLWPEQAHTASFLLFFAIVPLTWLAHTEGAARTGLAAALLSTAIAGTGAALGPGEHQLTYQFATLVLCGSMYFGLGLPLLYADNRVLRQRLTTDELTGTATRTFFLETAEREIDRARRFATPVSVVVFDVDHFKSANDSHGHPFGDLVLSEVAERCRTELRASDLLGRLGGDEFGVLLPMTAFEEARGVAERMAAAVRATPVQRGRRRLDVTASFGVAEIDPARDGIRAGLERADRGLYEAKRRGRNQVGGAEGPTTETGAFPALT